MSSSETLTDEQLAARVQAGDFAAFERLVDRHLQHVRTYAALKAPNLESVDEIARRTFVFAFENIRQFTPDASWRGWLRAIVWSLAGSEIRRVIRAEVNPSDYAKLRFKELQRETIDPYESLEAETFEDSLRTIPAPLTKVLYLKYREKFPTEEIARILNKNTAWVRTVLFRVRQDLNRSIEKETERSRTC